MTISEKIRTQRKQLALSQEKLGERLGVSRQAITKWENGAAMPESDKVTLLAECFGVSTDYLLKEDMDVPEEIIAHIVMPPKKRQWLKIIGITLLSITALLALVLWLLSVCYPVSYMDWDGGHITGFRGFLEIHELWPESYLLAAVGLLGLVLIAIDFVLKRYGTKQKKNPV